MATSGENGARVGADSPQRFQCDHHVEAHRLRGEMESMRALLAYVVRQRDAAFRELGWLIPADRGRYEVVRLVATDQGVCIVQDSSVPAGEARIVVEGREVARIVGIGEGQPS